MAKYYVRNSDEHRKHEIDRWRAASKGKRLPKYFQVFVRVGDIQYRPTGKIFLTRLDEKLTPPGARPPIEAEDEITRSGLLRFPAAGSTVRADGAWPWPRVIKKHFPKLINVNVNHRKKQWVRRKKNRAGQWIFAGTQMLDRSWNRMKVRSKFCGKATKNRQVSHASSHVWNRVMPRCLMHNCKFEKSAVAAAC